MIQVPTYIFPLLIVLAGFYFILLGQGLKIGPAFLKGKEYARIIGVFVVLGGAFKLLFSGGAPAPEQQPAPIEQTAAEIVAAMKEKRPLPLQLDSTTRLTSLDAEGNKIIYTVTIEETGELSFQKASAAIRELPKMACEEQSYITFFKMGLTVETKYINGEDKHVGTLSIAPERCGY